MLGADGWVTGAAATPRGSAPQTCCPERGPCCHRKDLHFHLHHPYASTCGLLLDTALQAQTYARGHTEVAMVQCMQQTQACHFMSSSPPSLTLPTRSATSGKSVVHGHPRSGPDHTGPTALQSSEESDLLYHHVTRTCSGIFAYTSLQLTEC